jgi:Cysteine-rich CPXCG
LTVRCPISRCRFLDPIKSGSDSSRNIAKTVGPHEWPGRHRNDCNPYCGESFETPVDTSSGSARYVEDCQICCQPIEFSLEVDHAGVLQSLSTLRGD